MKTKTIFKALALAMLMPATMLTTACSSDDDAIVNNNENTEVVNEKGYPLQVTVNVTREGDATTRAEYNESTKKLEFSTGDQLFVSGYDSSDGGAKAFAGTLTWTSGGTFSGSITTEEQYTGTFDALFTKGGAYAILLPAGYDTNYEYLSITTNNVYDAWVDYAYSKTIASSKAAAVEQFSHEYGTYSSGTGFALKPQNAILNFTITGLTPNATGVTATLKEGSTNLVSGSVNANSSGHATFAMAIRGDSYYMNELTLTIGGNDITFTSSYKNLEKGHVYNVLKKVGSGLSLVDAFTEGNTTAISFGDYLTLTSTYSGGSFGAVTPTGSMSGIVTGISMARRGNNLVINLTDTESTPTDGSLTIDIANNTYSWDNEYFVMQLPTLSDIKINSTSITPLPYKMLNAASTSDCGMAVCAAGHLHPAKTALPSGCTAVGIIGKVTGVGHGLILALQDANYQTWNTINGWESVTTYAGTTLKLLPDADARGSLTSYTTLGETAVSNWCVAQKSDYEAIFDNLGSKTISDGTTYDSFVNEYITNVGGTAMASSNWSATEVDGSNAWDFHSNKWYSDGKVSNYRVRPVLGF